MDKCFSCHKEIKENEAIICVKCSNESIPKKIFAVEEAKIRVKSLYVYVAFVVITGLLWFLGTYNTYKLAVIGCSWVGCAIMIGLEDRRLKYLDQKYQTGIKSILESLKNVGQRKESNSF
jgi:hypothetical protein